MLRMFNCLRSPIFSLSLEHPVVFKYTNDPAVF